MPLPKIGVEAVVENLDGYKRAIKAINDANDAASANVEQTAKSFSVLGKVSAHVANIFDEAFGNIIAGAALKAFDAVMGAIGGIINAIGNFIRGIGNAIGAVMDFAGALARDIFKSGVTFSSTMANISSITKLTGKDLNQLAKDLIEIGADSAAGPQLVAEAYYEVASGVADVSQRLPILQAAVALSEAGQANLTATTNGLISAVNAYASSLDASGKAQLTAARAADIYQQVVNVGVGSMDNFVDALAPLGGLAANQKVDFGELGGALAYMTTQGGKAAERATQLKAVMTLLARNTPQVTKALKAMGEKSIEASIAANGLGGTLALLVQGAKKTGQNLATITGSVEALQAVTTLSTPEFQKFFDTFIEGVDGATAAARELQRTDVSYQLKLIGSRFQALGLSISQAVLPAFNKFLTFINKSFEKINWKKIGAGLEKMGEILGNVAGGIVDDLGKAFESLDFEKLSTDIGVVIANIGQFFATIDWNAIGAAIGSMFQGIGAFVSGIDWGQLVTGITTVITGISNVITGIDWAAVGTSISNVFNGIVTFIGSIDWATLATNISNAVKSVSDWLGSIDWPKLLADVQTFVTGAGNIFKGIVQFVIDAKAEWDKQWTELVTNLELVKTNIETGINNIGLGIQTIWNVFFGPAGFITVAWDGMWTQINAAVDAAIAPIEAAFNAVSGAVMGVWNILTVDIPNGIITAINNVISFVTGIVNAVKATFAKITVAIVSALQPAVQFINGLISAIANILNFSGGGGPPGNAAGGSLKEGLNIVGEQGPEAIIKHGSKALVIPAGRTMGIMDRLDTMLGAGPGGGGLSSMMGSLAPMPVPIHAGGSSSYDNSVTNNNNQSNITLNGVRNAENAVERMAMLKAAGRL